MFSRFGTAVVGIRGASLVTFVTAVALLAVGALVNNLWAAPRVPAAGRAVLEQCAGDCDGDGTVTVDDIIKMVGIATSAAPLSECPAGDGNSDDQVTIDDLIAAVNNALSGCPEPATPLTRGLRALAAGDARAANDAFAEAATIDPNNDLANLYFAGTRLVIKLLDDPQLRDLRNRSGVIVAGDTSHVCDLDVALPDVAPAGAPRTGEVVDKVREVLLPEVRAAIANLARIPAGAALQIDLTSLPACLRPETDEPLVEVDRADLLIAGAGLDGVAGLLDLSVAYDLDASLQQLLDGPSRTVVQANPQLLTLRSAATLATSRDAFSGALGKFVQAIDAVSAETDNQDDDFLVLDDDESKDAGEARLLASMFQQSLTGQVAIPVDVVTGEIVVLDIGLLAQERIDLSRLFSGQLATLRSMLPAFDEDGDFDTGRFGDPKFGGMAPDMTQAKIDDFLTGGPPCAPCTDDDDCDAFGAGDFHCGYCEEDCTGEEMRCSDWFRECDDGIFY